VEGIIESLPHRRITVNEVASNYLNRTPLRVLVVEDSAADADLMRRELKRGGFDVVVSVVRTPEAFRCQLETGYPDLVLSDYELGAWHGMDALEILTNMGVDIPFILVSGAVGDVTAVECIKRGVTDYVLKGSLARLPIAVRRALQEKDLRACRKHAEDELARSNHDLEQFAYIASHDLQEPLRMIATYTQLLSKYYQGKLDEQADKYIHYAVDGATRMQVLIQDLLTFSRVGSQALQLKVTNSNAVLMAALVNVAGAVNESGAKIEHDDLPMVMANPPQLLQVFQNLIGNAIKFHGIESPHVTISAKRVDTGWIFAISDNGIGITVEHTESVFVIFRRLHTREEYPGTGIGLAICRKIIERHGGKIWIEARPKGGITVKFNLASAKYERTDSEQAKLIAKDLTISL
jgi:signal transduction histidine kinase